MLVKYYIGIFSSDAWHAVRITEVLSTCKDLVLLQLISFLAKL